MKKPGTLTKLQALIALTMADNPYETQTKIAEMVGTTKEYVSEVKHKPEFQDYLQELLDERWSDLGRKARKQMEQLVDNGDYRAVEFVLKTTGLNPTTKIEADVKEELVVNITGELNDSES